MRVRLHRRVHAILDRVALKLTLAGAEAAVAAFPLPHPLEWLRVLLLIVKIYISMLRGKL